MVTFLLVALALLLFQLLVILHEYGHFLVAKRNGVEVEEFGLGFPPKIAGKTMGKGIFKGYYTLNWLPLGGFVKLKGENDTAKGKGTYGSQRLWVKAKIILAGVTVNFLIAVVMFTFLALIGVPRLLPSEPLISDDQFTIASDTEVIESRALVSFIAEDSPASASGLELGDQITALNSVPIANDQDLIDSTKGFAGQEVTIDIVRDRQNMQLTTTFNSEEVVQGSVDAREACQAAADSSNEACPSIKGYMGVIATDFVLQRNTWSAPIVGAGLAVQYTKVTLQGLWGAISSLFQGDTQTASESVAGPIGIFFVFKEGANLGLRFILMIIAIISLTLAIMNSLPIPALDGGRLALTVFYRKILKRPLTKDKEERIVGTSMAGLLLLMLLITIVDVRRFF